MQRAYFKYLQFTIFIQTRISVVPEAPPHSSLNTGRVVPLILSSVTHGQNISLSFLSQLDTHRQNPLFSLSDSYIGCFIGKKVTHIKHSYSFVWMLLLCLKLWKEYLIKVFWELWVNCVWNNNSQEAAKEWNYWENVEMESREIRSDCRKYQSQLWGNNSSQSKIK